MEAWLSGRKYLTANEASCKRLRGFESLRLRQVELARDALKNKSFLLLKIATRLGRKNQ